MITVQVRFFGILAAYAGASQQDVTVAEGTTVQQLLVRLGAAGSDTFRSILLQGDRPNFLLRVVRNELPVEAKGLQAPLADGDALLLFSIVSGGSSGDEL